MVAFMISFIHVRTVICSAAAKKCVLAPSCTILNPYSPGWMLGSAMTR